MNEALPIERAPKAIAAAANCKAADEHIGNFVS